MIMGSLGVATLSAAKLFLSESKTSTNISETAGAYYAAESALEKALLEYKIDAGIQLSSSCDNRIDNKCVATASDGWKESNSSLTNTAKTFTKIYSYANSIENLTGIHQDESREFKVLDKNATLEWTWTDPSVIGQGLRIIYIDMTTLEVDKNKSTSDIFKQSPDNTLTIPLNTLIRVRPLKGNIATYTLKAADDGKIDMGETVIDVKSEYRGVSRQLQVKINRNKDSGNTLNSLFDYTLLGECGLDNNDCTQ